MVHRSIVRSARDGVLTKSNDRILISLFGLANRLNDNAAVFVSDFHLFSIPEHFTWHRYSLLSNFDFHGVTKSCPQIGHLLECPPDQ